MPSGSTAIGRALSTGVLSQVISALTTAGLNPRSPEAILAIVTLTYRKTMEVLHCLRSQKGNPDPDNREEVTIPVCTSVEQTKMLEHRLNKGDERKYRTRLVSTELNS